MRVRNFMHDGDMLAQPKENASANSFEYLVPFNQTIFTEINLFFIEIRKFFLDLTNDLGVPSCNGFLKNHNLGTYLLTIFA